MDNCHRDKLKEALPQHSAKEIDLQLLAGSLAPGESTPIAPGVWFSKTVELQFDPDPAPEGWQEEFGRAYVHPRTGEIVFHRGLLEGPALPWKILDDKESSIGLLDAWKVYLYLHPILTTLAFRDYPRRERKTTSHRSPEG